jgi:hypothetical protein
MSPIIQIEAFGAVHGFYRFSCVCGILSSVYIIKLFLMSELRKRPVARRRSAVAPLAEGGAAPHSGGSTCGHARCQESCNVRYVGPISHIRDHHAIHAARGVSHIWSASIITGFAIILTGAVAFQTAQARNERSATSTQAMAQNENRALMARLDRMERLLVETRAACRGEEAPESEESVQMRADEARIRAELEAKKKLLPPARPTSTRDTATSTQDDVTDTQEKK